MHSSATAGIEFHGASMRYAEIEQYGSRCRLLRLGDCEFEFDVTEVLLSGGSEKYLDIVTDALSEIFLGTTATLCRIVVHPPVSRVLHSVSSVGLDVEDVARRLGFESALVFDDTVHTNSRHVVISSGMTKPEGIELHAVHASEVPTVVKKRFDKVSSGLKGLAVEVVSSSFAATRILHRLATEKEDTDVKMLAVGLFENATEYSLVRDGSWVFHQSRDEIHANDVGYFALHALRLADITTDELDGIVTYGPDVSAERCSGLERIFRCPIDALEPTDVVDLNVERFEDGFQFEQFAVCLGAAL